MDDDDELYEITIEEQVNVESMVEHILGRRGTPAGVQVSYEVRQVTVPVTYQGCLEDLMEIAVRANLGLEEFEELCELVPKS